MATTTDRPVWITPILIIFLVIGYGRIEQCLVNLGLVNLGIIPLQGRLDFSKAHFLREELAARAHMPLTHHRVHAFSEKLGND